MIFSLRREPPLLVLKTVAFLTFPRDFLRGFVRLCYSAKVRDMFKIRIYAQKQNKAGSLFPLSVVVIMTRNLARKCKEMVSRR